MKTVAIHCASQKPGQPFSFSPLLLHRTSSVEPTLTPTNICTRKVTSRLVPRRAHAKNLVWGYLDIVASFPGPPRNGLLYIKWGGGGGVPILERGCASRLHYARGDIPGLALMKTTDLEPMRTLSYFRLDTLP